MAGFFEKTVGPVAFETSARNVRRAFELGCSAVIIDGTLPDIVAAEMAAIPSSGITVDGEIRNATCLRAEGDGSEDLFWQRGFFPDLPETGQWMIEQARQAVAAGLRPALDLSGKTDLMTLWQNDVIYREWHVDDAGTSAFPDVHFHIWGGGMQIAAPAVSTKVRININERSLVSRFQSTQDGAAHIPAGMKVDFNAELQERGFQVLSLNPGQILVFGKDCVHQSGDTRQGQRKLRGAMF